MLLTQTARYALRAMSCLALQPPQEPLRSQELARQTSPPSSYLSKVMRQLVLAGLVTSQRGHSGGFQLAKPPRQIHFIEILTAVDYHIEAGRCAFGVGSCDPLQPCPLHHTWSTLVERFDDWARQTSLAEITSKPPPIADT
ncbi:MAG: Rrf2 family iron-sulfur cluster assembly transcriptional regulator [Myxococcota bacterium]|jgi:Rrf2 family iron-sulfur cluster assembly transcriptional regulator